MKQNVVIVSLLVLAALYNLITLSVSDNLITFIGAFVMFKLTNSLLPTLAVFVIMPLVVYMKQQKIISVVKKEEGFHTDGAVQISERVKGLARAKNTATPQLATTGVLESPEIESFQNIDASGAEVQEGFPGVSVPAFVREKGRLLVVPESSVPRSRSDDIPPKPQTMVEGRDGEGETTALVSDATKLPEAPVPGVMNVGPAELE
jgi:hypothetical protein